MSPEPKLDLTAPLTRLRPGQQMQGFWVHPIYAARGYPDALPSVWVRVQVARRLLKALPSLMADHLGLVVWDGWRSRELQATLWEEHRAELGGTTGLAGDALDSRARDFVSPPSEADALPAHITGGAVDVSLCTLDGTHVDMGSEFDELTDRSHGDYYERLGLSGEEKLYRDRRRVLLRAMAEAGFWRLDTEWWHYEFQTPNWAAHAGGQPRFAEAPPPPNK